MANPYMYKYDDQYAIVTAVRTLLENLPWANKYTLKPEQITAVFQDPGNNPKTFPRVNIYLIDAAYYEFDPAPVEEGTGWELWKDCEFTATLRVECVGENPVQVSYLMSAVKHALLDTTRSGTYSRYIDVPDYIVGKQVSAKLLLNKPSYVMSERDVTNKVCKGILDGDITMPVYTIHTTIEMVPEYDVEVESVEEVVIIDGIDEGSVGAG